MALKYKSTWKGFRPRQPAKGSTLRQQGKKGKENQKVNREKKQEHLVSGITSCELRISPRCTPFDGLTWAHDRKRRNMGKCGSPERAENMRKSVLACLNCHNLAELKGEALMMPIIQKAIDDRPNKLTEVA